MQQRTSIGKQWLGWRDRLSVRRRLGTLGSDLAELFRFRFVVGLLVANQLKVRYQRSSLGFLWTLINPLLMLTVLAVFMGQVLRIQIERYPVYLFSGMIPWQFFAAAVTNSSMSLVRHEALIRKVNAPKSIYPLAETLVAAVNMLFAMAALFVLLQFFSPHLNLQLVLVPVGLVLLVAFTCGAALTAMTLVTYFRDLEHVIGVVLQAFYFACPIIYQPENLAKYRWLLAINPMTHFLRFFQCAFYYGDWPSGRTWAAATICAVGSLVVGYTVYKGCEHDYVFRL